MRKWGFAILAIVIGLSLVAWYAFRRERLVVNQTVNEAFPCRASELGREAYVGNVPQRFASNRGYGDGLSPWG